MEGREGRKEKGQGKEMGRGKRGEGRGGEEFVIVPQPLTPSAAYGAFRV